jgi:hypothetical protein
MARLLPFAMGIAFLSVSVAGAIRTVLPEVPIVHERLPDSGEASYRVKQPLVPNAQYEVLISHSAAQGAAFTVHWRTDTGGHRALLNTEKLSFTTDEHGAPTAGAIVEGGQTTCATR